MQAAAECRMQCRKTQMQAQIAMQGQCNAMQVTQCIKERRNKSMSIPRSLCSSVAVQVECGRDRQVCRHQKIGGEVEGRGEEESTADA